MPSTASAAMQATFGGHAQRVSLGALLLDAGSTGDEARRCGLVGQQRLAASEQWALLGTVLLWTGRITSGQLEVSGLLRADRREVQHFVRSVHGTTKRSVDVASALVGLGLVAQGLGSVARWSLGLDAATLLRWVCAALRRVRSGAKAAP